MPERRASAVWNGSLTEGNGTMRMASGSYEGPYSFQSRFEEGDGTNPEELIAAAHAGCFSMALSGVWPRFPSSAERAIEKQPACAAAISSSGFVPSPSWNRDWNEYGPS